MKNRGVWKRLGYEQAGKRILDLVGAAAALPLLAVSAAVVGTAVHLSDGGPVFYKSERRGRKGKSFEMYKFRSMHVGAPDLRNADHSTVNSNSDSRVTNIGRFLRSTSLDELPQVLNVLKGDMSFVGPRPNMATQELPDLTDVERKRLTVRPGITGLAQAAHRNSIPTAQKYELDARYVDNVSLRMDLTILAKTVVSVACSRNINSPDAGKVANAE